MVLYVGCRSAHLVNIEFLNTLRERNDIKKIMFLNEQEHNYMNFGDENTLNFHNMIAWATEKNIEITIINGSRSTTKPMHDTTDPKYHCIKNIISWETAFFNVASHGFSKMIDRENKDFYLNSPEDIKYTLVSLNNKPHMHRCFMMDMLQKYGLVENQAISWINTTDMPGYFVTNFEFKYWQEKKQTLTDTYNEIPDSYKMMPAEYYSSFIQVVNESTMLCDFITEKTTMPLFLKKPFVVLNTKNYNFWLKELGFELYEEIFDYSFDSIDNFQDRFEAGVIEIARINSMSREKQFMLYKEIIPKLEHNKKLAIQLSVQTPEILKPVTNGTLVDHTVKILEN
jgi:hypothetical protein